MEKIIQWPEKIASLTEKLYIRLFYLAYTLGLKKSNFRKLSTREVFTRIYETNFWKGTDSKSGPGSSLRHTKDLRVGLEKILSEYQINELLDIPCGDFNWMSTVDLGNIKYTGGDIVESLINENQKRYSNRQRKFLTLDITSGPLPKVDLILCRDCLVHFSFTEISKAFDTIFSSQSKYLLVTSFSTRNFNYDITTGDWRPLNLQIEPFHFPPPLEIIDEQCTEANGKYRDKCLYLYEIQSLQNHLKKYKINKMKAIWHILTSSKFE